MEAETKGKRREHLSAFVKGIAFLLVVSLALWAMPGCSAGEGASGDAASGAETPADAGTFEEVAAAFSVDALDLDYTDRDVDPSYDEASAVAIELDGSTAHVEGDGASADGSVVTIASAGTYVLSGDLADGQVLVDAPEDAKVQLVLDGVAIHNDDGPALYVKQADKCFVTLADGSDNQLTDGDDYTLEDDSDEPYATLFSRTDLTLNGTGSLAVTSAYRHAVCSKDDLVVTGGTYVVDAVEDALRGRDCVKICDGSFTLTAGGDGVKSNKDDDAERGFVSIDGGSFSIDAGDDGIQAATYLRVAGGQLDVTAADDALHSDLEGELAGGDVTVDAGDDAFHAETKLVVNDGSMDVVSCYEGYEAEKIYVNGGDTSIVASDDGVNASAVDLSGSDDGTESASSEPGSASSGPGSAAGGPADESGDGGAAAPDPGSAPSGSGAPAGGDAPADGDMPSGGDMPADGAPPGDASSGGAPDSGDRDALSEREMNGGAPDNAFAEGGAAMGDEDCLIQINGGTLVLDALGDGVDSNGSVEVKGGTLLVNGPTSGGDGAFDYDLEATIAGGTVLMVGSVGMAQNFTSGTQPFSFSTAGGNAGQTVSVQDADGDELVSMTASKDFGMVLASSPSFEEGGAYSLVIDDSVTEITASVTPTGGFGGLGGDGDPLEAGMRGEAR